MTELHDIKLALKHYRYLKAFCENAIDAMEWYIGDCNIPVEIFSICESRVKTLTFMAHMDKAIETFQKLCIIDGKERTSNVVLRKYIDPKDGSNGKGKPYTNEQLADLFDCDISTIKRDISEGYDKLSILFFGMNGIK